MTIQSITPHELHDMMQENDGSLTVIDVRPKERYAPGHVPGALHYPLAKLQKGTPPFSKNKTIVTYCGGGTSGVNAAKILQEHGYNVRVMKGFRAWQAAGLPVSTDPEN